MDTSQIREGFGWYGARGAGCTGRPARRADLRVREPRAVEGRLGAMSGKKGARTRTGKEKMQTNEMTSEGIEGYVMSSWYTWRGNPWTPCPLPLAPCPLPPLPLTPSALRKSNPPSSTGAGSRRDAGVCLQVEDACLQVEGVWRSVCMTLHCRRDTFDAKRTTFMQTERLVTQLMASCALEHRNDSTTSANGMPRQRQQNDLRANLHFRVDLVQIFVEMCESPERY